MCRGPYIREAVRDKNNEFGEHCEWGQNGMGERPIEVDGGRERSKADPHRYRVEG